MKVKKDKKQGNWVDVYFDTTDKVYLGVSNGHAEHGVFGSRYMSLAPELAVKLANAILKEGEE